MAGAANSVETSAELLSQNQRAQLVEVAFDGESADDPVKDAVRELRTEASQLLQGQGLQAGLTGDAASAVDTEESFGSAETITFVATFVLILLLVGGIFRSPIAAFLPLVTIGLVFTLQGLGAAISPTIFGLIADNYDIFTAFYFLAATIIVANCLIVFMPDGAARPATPAPAVR